MTAPDAKPPCILLVDDHEDTLMLEAMLLRRHGYEVATAATAEQALALAEEKNVDLVVADLRLPDRNGLDLMRDLHELYELPGIALTGAADEGMAAAGARVGFVDLLLKPVPPEDLVEAIKAALAESEQGPV